MGALIRTWLDFKFPRSWSRCRRPELVVGLQPRIEPILYNRQSKRFAPVLPGISGESFDFTRDGKSMTYTQYPEGTLWKCRPEVDLAFYDTIHFLAAYS